MSLIEVRGLKKSFEGQEVLKGVDLTVEQGERIAIIGGSGCGKSTFLRCLELLEKPDAGQIFIDGQEITGKRARVDEIRRSMSMVYQGFHLFSEMDVMDNLCLAPVLRKRMTRAEAEEKALALLIQVGLASRAHAWPRQLSGGQQQRIAICRCLMMEPKVLLFDEPTSALDPTMVGEVLAVIRMLATEGLGMLIVTHEMSFAREVADRVLFFADGVIYEQGTPDQIFNTPRREKTIAFIRKIKYFTFEIQERHFDLMSMQGGIRDFAKRYGLEAEHAYSLQVCCEEMVVEFLNHCFPEGGPIDVHLEISYAEADHAVVIQLSSAGRPYNPLEQSDNALAVAIIRQTARKTDYRFDQNRNHLTIVL